MRTLVTKWPELRSSPKEHNKSKFLLNYGLKLKSVSSLTTTTTCIRSFIHEINQQQPRTILSLCIFFLNTDAIMQVVDSRNIRSDHKGTNPTENMKCRTLPARKLETWLDLCRFNLTANPLVKRTGRNRGTSAMFESLVSVGIAILLLSTVMSQSALKVFWT